MLLDEFLEVYPEFTPILTTPEQIAQFDAICNKIQCVYPNFNNINQLDCKYKQPFFMLVAHYLVVGGYAKSIGLKISQGNIKSVKLETIHRTFQDVRYEDTTSYWFSLTQYGKEYSSWWDTQLRSGFLYVG